MKKKLGLISLCALVLLLTGCGKLEDKVVGKKYTYTIATVTSNSKDTLNFGKNGKGNGAIETVNYLTAEENEMLQQPTAPVDNPEGEPVEGAPMEEEYTEEGEEVAEPAPNPEDVAPVVDTNPNVISYEFTYTVDNDKNTVTFVKDTGTYVLKYEKETKCLVDTENESIKYCLEK